MYNKGDKVRVVKLHFASYEPMPSWVNHLTIGKTYVVTYATKSTLDIVIDDGKTIALMNNEVELVEKGA